MQYVKYIDYANKCAQKKIRYNGYSAYVNKFCFIKSLPHDRNFKVNSISNALFNRYINDNIYVVWDNTGIINGLVRYIKSRIQMVLK